MKTTAKIPIPEIPLIFEKSRPGRIGIKVPRSGVQEVEPEVLWGKNLVRKAPPGLPELSELDVVRHFTHLSQRNVGVDTTFYPLGSCTMKYNPRAGEAAARIPGFARSHPMTRPGLVQGCLRLLVELEELLCSLVGMDALTFHPAAGAQGEITGLFILGQAIRARKENRNEILVPDSSHGTNPASATLAGFRVVQIPSNNRGTVDLPVLRKQLSEKTAGLMLTNPNTLGLFENEIQKIAEEVHRVGGYLYCDGANFNALIGRVRPGDMGFDLMHLNLHKTLSTPHGGGGPGAGPVAVKKELEGYLPGPRPCRVGEDAYGWQEQGAESIGRMAAFHGSFGILVRAYSYLRAHGLSDLRQVSADAVLNANYLRVQIRDFLDVPYDGLCQHEFVASAKKLKEETGISALDIAKALIDEGFHPPTIYFPLNVPEAMMIEPTETENKETLDRFVKAMAGIVQRAKSDPESLRESPRETPVGRLDEVGAARKPDVAYVP